MGIKGLRCDGCGADCAAAGSWDGENLWCPACKHRDHTPVQLELEVDP